MILVLFASTFLVVPGAFADEPPVKIEKPVDWTELLKPKTPDLQAFYKENTESRIEVYTKSLARVDQADKLFEAFSTKQESEKKFQRITSDNEKRFEMNDGKAYVGHYYEYKYDNDGVDVSVNVFALTINNKAIFVIAYYADANKDETLEAFNALIRNMTLNEAAGTN